MAAALPAPHERGRLGAAAGHRRPHVPYDVDAWVVPALAPGQTRWGLTPLDDQHVAGLIMALEQSIVMGLALAYLFIRMLSESEAEDQRAERFGDERLPEGEERYGAV